jgi:hypothetical protein
MAKLVMKAKGVDGEVELMDDRIVINRPGIWNAIMFKFDTHREIPFSGISEIKFKTPFAIMVGKIDFVMAGGTVFIGRKQSTVSPTAVKFNKKQQKEFEVLKEKVFELMSQQNRSQK